MHTSLADPGGKWGMYPPPRKIGYDPIILFLWVQNFTDINVLAPLHITPPPPPPPRQKVGGSRGQFEMGQIQIELRTLLSCENCSLRLFWGAELHDGKVRILNFNSKCAFWIMQCTHERSFCDIWITQNERPNLGFCIPAGEECLGTLPIKHAWSSHFLC